MTYSNPAANAAAAASSYVKALLEVLGSRQPLTVMGELLPWIGARIAGMSESTLQRPESAGKWSVLQVIQHLADSDLVMGYRIPISIALGQLRGLRAANLHLWTTLNSEQVERVGLHAERGPESVGHLLRLLGAHDLVHRRQLDRILACTR